MPGGCVFAGDLQGPRTSVFSPVFALEFSRIQAGGLCLTVLTQTGMNQGYQIAKNPVLSPNTKSAPPPRQEAMSIDNSHPPKATFQSRAQNPLFQINLLRTLSTRSKYQLYLRGCIDDASFGVTRHRLSSFVHFCASPTSPTATPSYGAVTFV